MIVGTGASAVAGAAPRAGTAALRNQHRAQIIRFIDRLLTRSTSFMIEIKGGAAFKRGLCLERSKQDQYYMINFHMFHFGIRINFV